MLNLLFQIARQIQLGDQASIQALINIITGIVAAVGCILYIYRWRLEVMRVALAGFMLFLSVWAAVAYAIILYVDAGLSVALLRWVISCWHIAAVGVLLLFHTIQAYDPDEVAQQRIEKLKHEAKTHLQNLDTWRNIVLGYKEREAAWNEERARMTADTTVIRQSLQDARRDLGACLAEKIELIEENERLRARGRDG